MSSLTLIEVKPGVRFPTAWLKKTLGNRPKWVVRFGAAYHLDAIQLGALLRLTCPDMDIVRALTMEAGSHSGHLQDYVVELGYENRIYQGALDDEGQDEEPDEEPELLVELFKQAEVHIASSVDDIIEEMSGVLGAMPGKEGRTAIKAKLKQDRKTGKLGINEASIVHEHHAPNIGVLDVSGSMGEDTVRRVVDEFVALCVKANAYLAIVSNNTFWWEPGTYSTDSVLAEAEYGGTQYETLSELFNKSWSTCVTLADWDSSMSAFDALGQCTGRIGLLLDISLVPRPTFLATCLEQLAEETRPLMVAKTSLTYDF